MSTSSVVKSSRKPAAKTVQTVAELKKIADKAYNEGTRQDRDRLLYANGLRKAWESKGYGRASARTALGIEQSVLWIWELVLPVGHPDHTAAMKAIAALPSIVKVKAEAKDSKDVKASAKPSDLI